MKKLLVLALVLSMGFVANAGLVTGDLVQGKLTYSADLDAKIVSIIAVAPVTTITFGTLIPDGPGLLTKGTIKAGMSGGAGDMAGDFGLAYADGTIVGISATTGTSAGTTGVLVTFGFTGLPNFVTAGAEEQLGLGNSEVYFQDGSMNSLNGAVIVPEPMTMILLGLGGLFLRRK